MSRRSQCLCILVVLVGLLRAVDASASNATVSGNCVDGSGVALSGVALELNCSCRKICPSDCRCCSAALKTTSNPNGQFSFSAEPGPHTIQASLAGYKPKSVEITLRKGKRVTVTITLERTKPAGR